MAPPRVGRRKVGVAGGGRRRHDADDGDASDSFGLREGLMTLLVVGLFACFLIFIQLAQTASALSNSDDPAEAPAPWGQKLRRVAKVGLVEPVKERLHAAPLDATPPPAIVAPAAVEARPAAPDEQDGCQWERHTSKYLGECVGGSCDLYHLDAAKRLCLDRRGECRGVTCEGEDAAYPAPSRCSLRVGQPYLASSPGGEVSYTNGCGPAAGKGSPEAEAFAASPADAPSSPGALQVATGAGEGGPLKRGLLAAPRLLIVVVAHNKPEELRECLKSLAALPDVAEVPIAVSLDDPPSFARMTDVVLSMAGRLRLDIWKKTTAGPLSAAVSKISEHFRFVLTEAFDGRHFEFALFLENDLKVAPDFLYYFRSSAWLLEEDPSLFCVSAWNDNGIAEAVSDEKRLFRTDYFPGLGWMIRADTWRQIRGKWPRFPSTGWDHWLRHGSGLGRRECIVPEVSRTHHMDVGAGATVHKGSKAAKRLQAMPLSKLPPGGLGDLSYLLQDRYDRDLQARVRSARRARIQDLGNLVGGGEYVIPYSREEYRRLFEPLQLSPAQPRAAHRGVIIARHVHSRARVILVDRRQGEGLLPEEDLWRPDPRRAIHKAAPAQSCQQLCAGLGLQCDRRQLEFINSCEHLQAAFPCEDGCGHQVGDELPAYVHDVKRDTARQCLMTDDLMPTCGGASPATTRLCVCVP